MTVGLVVALTPAVLGDTLSADVPAGATVLPVFDAVEFDEDFDVPRYLVMGNDLTPLQYVAVENDDEVQQSVTLAAGLPVAAEAGLPVTLWDPSVEAPDKRAVEFAAQVRLDDQDDATIPATIPHTLVPLAGIYSLEGAKVALEEDEDGDWFVDRVLGRAVVVDPDVLDRPRLTTIIQEDAPAGGGPPAPPASSPALTVKGMADAVVVSSAPLDATDKLALHMSTTQGFVPGSSTLVVGTPTAATVIPVTLLPSGAPLEPGVTYYFRSVATNSLGDATPGVEVSGSLNPDQVSSLVLATLEAGGVRAGRVDIGPGYWDPNEGIVVPQSDGQVTRISANPKVASVWAGKVVATFLTAMGGIVTGLMEVLGTVRLSTGVSAPRSAPEASTSWASMKLAYPTTTADVRRGLVTGLDATTWATLNETTRRVEIYTKNTGALVGTTLLGFNVPTQGAPVAVVVANSQYYALTLIDTYYYLWRVAADGVVQELLGGVAVDPMEIARGYPVLTVNPAGQAVVAWPKAGTTKVSIRTISLTTGLHLAILNVEMGFTKTLGSINWGTFDYGVDRIIVSPAYDEPKVFTTAGARSAGDEFPRASNAAAFGLAYSSNQFHTLNDTGTVQTYETNKVAGNVVIGHAWASESSTATTYRETTVGPTVTHLRPARAALDITTTPPPEAGQTGADKANRVSIYVGTTATNLTRQTILPVVTNKFTLRNQTTSGALPQTTNGFATIASTGRLISEATKADGTPVIDFRGDGLWWLGPMRGNATQRLDPHTRAGIDAVEVSGTNPVAASKRVEFGFTYPTAPAVTATIRALVPTNFAISVGAADTTGVTVYVTRTSGGQADAGFNWTATPV